MNTRIFQTTFVVGSFLWFVLLLGEASLDLFGVAWDSWPKFHLRNRDLPGVARWLIPFEVRFGIPGHRQETLLAGMVLLPLLLQRGWKHVRAKRLFWIACGIFVLPVLVVLFLQIQKLDGHPAAPLYYIRALAFSIVFVGLSFLPGVKCDRPGEHLFCLLLAGLPFLSVLGSMGSGPELFFGLPTWAAVAAALIICFVIALQRTPRYGSYFVSLIIGLTSFGLMKISFSVHRSALTQPAQSPSSVDFTFGRVQEHDATLTPAAVNWRKDRNTGILNIPVARYEMRLPLRWGGHRSNIQKMRHYLEGYQVDDQGGWQVQWWSRPKQGEDGLHCWLTILLSNPKSPSSLFQKDFTVATKLDHEFTVWSQIESFGQQKGTLVSVEEGKKCGANPLRVYAEKDTWIGVIGYAWNGFWRPNKLWAGFEESAYLRPLKPRQYWLGDFTSGAVLSLPFSSDYILRTPRGTSLERSSLKPGEFLLPGDLIADPAQWWAASETRAFEYVGEERWRFTLILKLPTSRSSLE